MGERGESQRFREMEIPARRRISMLGGTEYHSAAVDRER